MTPLVCAIPRCPNPAFTKWRGRCQLHRKTEDERGYGREWRKVRARVREPQCQRCGSTSDLTVDHIVPQSMGGTNEHRNLPNALSAMPRDHRHGER
jgi:5-methylcytosine-specific restriction endonuclease McrA